MRYNVSFVAMEYNEYTDEDFPWDYGGEFYMSVNANSEQEAIKKARKLKFNEINSSYDCSARIIKGNVYVYNENGDLMFMYTGFQVE